MTTYKPTHYNALSLYLIVDKAQQLVDLFIVIFDAKVLRRFDRGNGQIAHIELMLDDTVLMRSDSTEHHPANKTMLHLYVPDGWTTFDKAIAKGQLIKKAILIPGVHFMILPAIIGLSAYKIASPDIFPPKISNHMPYAAQHRHCLLLFAMQRAFQ